MASAGVQPQTSNNYANTFLSRHCHAMSNPSEGDSPLLAAPTRRKTARIRCGECEACQREDCGECQFCKAKRKFGGDGTSTSSCIHRKCVNLKERMPTPAQASNEKSPAAVVAGTKRNRPKKKTDGADNVARLEEFLQQEEDNRALEQDDEEEPPTKKKKRGSYKKKSRADAQKRTKAFLYGQPVPSPVPECCASCYGSRTEELALDPIILCDGCDREFHLDCCKPPLVDIPEGSYHCIDCSPKGTTSDLERYFDEHHEKRCEFQSSKQFVESMVQRKRQEERDEGSSSMESENRLRIPMSELARLSKTHHDALKTPTKDSTKETKAPSRLGPDYLIGKSIRLYCPIGNQYHSGRIVDWRPAKIPGMKEEYWDSDVGHVEFLVRFLAGKDFRKTTIVQWIILEEHSLAVGMALVWGMALDRDKGLQSWMPAQIHVRTTLEILPVQSMLSSFDKQIYFVGDVVQSSDPSWSLATFWGEDTCKLLLLEHESIDFLSKDFCLKRLKVSSVEPPGYRLDICLGIAQVEVAEEERCRVWYNMPLQNKRHPLALTLRDESLLYNKSNRDDRLCPCIPIGFDRIHVLGPGATRDEAASLKCELMAPSPSLLRDLVATTTTTKSDEIEQEDNLSDDTKG